MFDEIDPVAANRVLERGANAAELLDNAAFIAVVNRLSQEHLAAVMASPVGPPGRDEREQHHVLHYALTEIVSALQQEVAAADDMKLRLQLRDGLGDEQEDA